MKTITEALSEEMKKAFEGAGYQEDYGNVTVSNRPDLCQYQCNGAMSAAKRYKKAPIQIAGEVVERLKDSATFEKVEAVPPGFVNIVVSNEFLVKYINEMKKDPRLGCRKEEKQRTVIIDYGAPNIAKPLHVGHLRSTIIGESVKRILRFMGNKVIGDVHLGDWGLPMGLVITELKKRNPEWAYFQGEEVPEEGFPEEAPFTINDLEEIYPYASKKSKEDVLYYEEAQEVVAKLQKGHKGYRALWKKMVDISIKDVKQIFKKLNAEFDLWKGESDANPYIDDMVDYMKREGYARISEGALVVDVKEETDNKEVPPCMILKSNGTALYATTDLATIIDRERNFHPDEIIYLTDKRQELNFEQVFRCAKKTKLVREETRLTFIGFGTMNNKDGKPFKTREGGVYRLDQLLSDAIKAAYDKVKENKNSKEGKEAYEDNGANIQGMTEEETREIAEKVGMAAIKYGDLSNQASKDYVFDLDRFLSFEGNTGPYIIYTIVRIQSIIRKFKERGGVWNENATILEPSSKKELDICLQLTKFQETIEQAYRENAPHKLCQFLYELSNAFNSFYHESRILTHEDEGQKTSWLQLLNLVHRALTTCVDLLGLEVPERM